MRRVFVSILAILYSYYTIGATIHEHYCMGELVDISLFGIGDEKCAKCGMEKHSENNDCCKDVQVVIKSSEDHIFSPHVQLSQSIFEIIPPVSFTEFSEIYYNKIAITCNASAAHAPPVRHVPIYIHVQNFRI